MGLLEASCATTSDALSDRLEGELRGLRRVRVARHLACCGNCLEMLGSLSRLVRALRTVGELEPRVGSSVVDDVLARIREGVVDGGR